MGWKVRLNLGLSFIKRFDNNVALEPPYLLSTAWGASSPFLQASRVQIMLKN